MARHKRRNYSLRLPAAVLLITLTLVGGRTLLAPGMGAEAPASTPAPAPAVTPLPAPTPTPDQGRPQVAPRPTQALPELAPAPDCDYASPVPESEAAAEDWFSDAAFLGDSLTDGLLLYSGIQGADNLSYKGLTVQSARTKAVIQTPAGKVTALDALGQKSYGKIYVLLGVNELGWYNDQRFYKTYSELVDLIREKQPDAQLYLQTLLPVTAEKSASHAYINNPKILVYNQLIAQLAQEKEVYLLDLHAAFTDETGALPAGDSSDGVHLKRASYKQWLDHLSTHTVQPD